VPRIGHSGVGDVNSYKVAKSFKNTSKNTTFGEQFGLTEVLQYMFINFKNNSISWVNNVRFARTEIRQLVVRYAMGWYVMGVTECVEYVATTFVSVVWEQDRYVKNMATCFVAIVWGFIGVSYERHHYHGYSLSSVCHDGSATGCDGWSLYRYVVTV